MGDAPQLQLSSTDALVVPDGHVLPREVHRIPDPAAARPLRVASVRRDTIDPRDVLPRRIRPADRTPGPAPRTAGMTLEVHGSMPTLVVSEQFLTSTPPETFLQLRQALALLPDIAGLARPGDRGPWAFLRAPSVDLVSAWNAAVAVDHAVTALADHPSISGIVRRAGTTADLDALARVLAGPVVGLDAFDTARQPGWTAASTALVHDVAAFTAADHPGCERATPATLDLPLTDMAALAEPAPGITWLRRRRRLTTIRTQLAPTLNPGPTVRLRDLPVLLRGLLDMQRSVRALAAQAATVPGIRLPHDWNPMTEADGDLVARQVERLRRVGAVLESTTGFAGALRWFVDGGPATDPAAARAVAQLRDAFRHLLTTCSSSPAVLAAWTGDDGLVVRWIMTRPERLVADRAGTSLRRRVELLTTLEPVRAAGLTEVWEALLTGTLPAASAARALDRGLVEAVSAAVQVPAQDIHPRPLRAGRALHALPSPVPAVPAPAPAAAPVPAAAPIPAAVPAPAVASVPAAVPAPAVASVPLRVLAPVPAAVPVQAPSPVPVPDLRAVPSAAPVVSVAQLPAPRTEMAPMAAVPAPAPAPVAVAAPVPGPVAVAAPVAVAPPVGAVTLAPVFVSAPTTAPAVAVAPAPAAAAPVAAPVASPVAVAVPDSEPVRAHAAVASFRAAPRPTTARGSRGPVRLPAGLSGEKPFVPWTPETVGDRSTLDRLNDPAAVRTIRRVMQAGIKAEGPIHQERLARLTAAAFGLSRVSEARRAQILGLLPSVTLHGDFVWPKHLDPSTWSGFRRQVASSDRPLEHVPPEEIANAMVALCRAGEGMNRDALFLGTLQVLGYNRRTPALVAHLDTVLENTLAAGRLGGDPAGVLTA